MITNSKRGYPPADASGGASYYRQGQIDLLARLRAHETRLQEIREREQRATAGPWVVEEQESDHGGFYITGHITATAHHYAGNKISRTDSVNDPNSLTRHDAEFIAHARSDVAFLLDLLDQAQREAQGA